MTKNIHMCISAPPETRKKLRQLSVDLDKTLSDIVIKLIDDAYQHKYDNVEPPSIQRIE